MPTTVSDYTALLSGSSWWGDKTVGKPVFITYSFETKAYDYLSELGFSAEFKDSFEPMQQMEQSAAFFALLHWEGASGVRFLEVPAGQGDIRFGRYDLTKNPSTPEAAAFAYEPLTAIDRSGSYSLAPGGDIFVDLSVEDYSFYGEIHVLTHEIGHALGLKHPFEGDVRLDSTLDTVAHTVMSYGEVPGTMPKLGDLDEAAIAYLYGPDKGDGTQVASWTWDNKTYTLTQTGGAGSDTIRGVSTADLIRAGAGDDLVFGGTGDDRIFAGANDDVVFADAGDDTVAGEDGDDILHAGAGKDVLSGGAGDDGLVGYEGDDVLKGEAGDDYLDGGAGNDTLDGGAGDDVLAGGAGNDTLDGGAAGPNGNTADYSEARQGVRVDLNGMVATGNEIGRDVLRSIANVVGGNGADVLTGDTGANGLWGGAGDDRLAGGAGDDALDGEGGADRLSGEAGNDLLDGGDGNDILDGGADRDSLLGRAGDDRLAGGAGDDLLDGGDGADRLSGEAGNDRLVGGAGNDALDGGAGDDVLVGGAGDDALDGGRGGEVRGDVVDYGDARQQVRIDLNGMKATVDGKAVTYHATGAEIGRDTFRNVESIVGGLGADLMTGDAAANRFSGGAGNDGLKGNDGADILDGGLGLDRLEGGAGDDWLEGGAGNDVLIGEAGDDRLVGGAGDDLLDGRRGGETFGDMVDYREAIDAIVVDLNGMRASVGGKTVTYHATGAEIGRDVIMNVEIVKGGFGADRMTGDAGANRFSGEAGNDTLKGNDGADVLDGGLGLDRLEGGAGNDRLIGGAGNDVLIGETGDDVLVGGAGDDLLDGRRGGETLGDTADYGLVTAKLRVDLNGMQATVDGKTVTFHATAAEIGRDVLLNVENVTGGAGNDALFGNAAANRLDGGAGNDTLKGAGGADILTGGAGADRFVFDTGPAANEADRITDFTAGSDALWLDRDVFTALKAGRLADGQFHAGSAAHDADDRLIFDAKTSSLFYDADGTGAQAQIKVAVIEKVAVLAASDFLIVV